MIKLSELVQKEFQPSEKSRMKNYLKGRPSRDQENVHTDPEVYGEMLKTSDRPENTNTSQRYNNGYPWSFDDPSGIFEDKEQEQIHQALIGREFQTLEDVAKMASRLRQAGFTQSSIEHFIKNYLV